MADVKISALTALGAAPAAADQLPIVDSSAGATKKVTIAELFTNPNVTGTVTADGLTVDGNTIINKDPTNSIVSYSNSQVMLDQSGGANVRSTIGFGAGSAGTYIPAAISYQTTDAVGSTKGTLNFYTRDATTDSPTLLRQKIDTNGDISFYEDTGTTAKFFWDASAESLGIGTTSATAKIKIINTADVQGINVETTASTYTDSAVFINNTVSTGGNLLRLRSVGSDKVVVTGTGNVGIGTTSPVNKLQVNVTGAGSPYAAFNSASDNPFLEMQRWSGAGTDYYGTRIENQVGNTIFKSSNGAAVGSQTFTERMRIDSLGNVGIGTASPAEKLDVIGTISTSASNAGATAGYVAKLRSQYGPDALILESRLGPVIKATAYGGQLAFLTGDPATAERARIDSSGNLLVGTTTLAPATSGNTSGAHIYPSGQAQFSQIGTTALVLNRKTNDGAIAEFRKEGTAVGSIGNLGTRMYIDGSGVSGINFSSGALIPRNNGSASDAVINIGGASNRFKDLYLSGGVYLGGTGAANLLDDYEEGTFTPVIADANTGGNTGTGSTIAGRYTKVGRFVNVQITLNNIDTTGMTSGNILHVRNLPFTTSVSNSSTGSIHCDQVTFGDTLSMIVGDNRSYVYFRKMTSGSVGANLTVGDLVSGSSDFILTLSYETA